MILTQKAQVLKDGAVLIFLPGIRQIKELQVTAYSCNYVKQLCHVLRVIHVDASAGSVAVQSRVWPGENSF